MDDMQLARLVQLEMDRLKLWENWCISMMVLCAIGVAALSTLSFMALYG